MIIKNHTKNLNPQGGQGLVRKLIIFLCKKSIRKIIRLIIEKLINEVDALQLIEFVIEFFENFN
ncbi:hypothetical protein EB1_04140 [Empedobacter brevis NBRC 14943 = ATCC 43319]|uniref:Uncharacterized protein n=1 Tax=Empedobacter brevis NBRC 14943 = ATCC 43319 TaxID=1218108 RepID=A0A511NCT1_9FLAO|nr:hypothetical protein EB1_04140 [Empedobacter brevis NBRC 14943 = ATCC 43319]